LVLRPQRPKVLALTSLERLLNQLALLLTPPPRRFVMALTTPRRQTIPRAATATEIRSVLRPAAMPATLPHLCRVHHVFTVFFADSWMAGSELQI
jgi:hypothetical protein